MNSIFKRNYILDIFLLDLSKFSRVALSMKDSTSLLNPPFLCIGNYVAITDKETDDTLPVEKIITLKNVRALFSMDFK